MDLRPSRKPNKGKQLNKSLKNGMGLEIIGKVQHDSNELKQFMMDNQIETSSNGNLWNRPLVNRGLHVEDDGACSLNFH